MKITIDITDEQAACTLSCLPAGVGTDEERVAAYYQTQTNTIASGFVKNCAMRRLMAKGLPARVADIGLDAEALAALEAHADAKIAARAASK